MRTLLMTHFGQHFCASHKLASCWVYNWSANVSEFDILVCAFLILIYCIFSGLITTKHGDLIPRDKFSGQAPPRQKRVRTSFKHTQLRAMKTYFALNHNPDAKDLKELAKKTQLSKRVLQVNVDL